MFRGQIEYTLFYVVNLRFILTDRKEIVKFRILTKFNVKMSNSKPQHLK